MQTRSSSDWRLQVASMKWIASIAVVRAVIFSELVHTAVSHEAGIPEVGTKRKEEADRKLVLG